MELRYYPNRADEKVGGAIRPYMADMLADLRSYAEEFDHHSESLMPVSYTHLDVYKRQAVNSALGAKWAFPLRNSTPAAPGDWPSCAATSISSTAMVRFAKAR